MLAARWAQEIEAIRCRFRKLHVDFAVKQAQRIALESITAILAQLGEMGAAVFQHRLAKTPPNQTINYPRCKQCDASCS